jgi:luciferase family oxidoreductase group 1
MQQYSLLDLSPVSEGSDVGKALSNTLDLAICAEKCGYHRYWLAEHHNMPGIASAATSVVISRVAAETKKMRVGAGGVMLPNHSPLVIAEQFGTLASFFPDRIDLGLGRAPGSDMLTARALRRSLENNENFPNDVLELLSYFSDGPSSGVEAIPGTGTNVPVWILGSSLFGAELAAHLGLPYAFASHFSPTLIEQALHIYRSNFNASKWLSKPYVTICAGVCVADTDDEAYYLKSSQILSFSNLIMGKPSKLPHPVKNIDEIVPNAVLKQVEQTFSCSATGSIHSVERALSGILDKYKPDELMVTGAIYDHTLRKRSFELASEILSNYKTS